MTRKITCMMLVISLLVACLIPTSAHGPERETYTNESPAPYAIFNSITDNVAVGDERNFVRIREAGSTDTYTDEIEIVPGSEYEVYIYYHNNAASNTNETGYGMATNVRVASAYPVIVKPGERGMVSGIISWSYVTPEDGDNPQTGTVWDEAYVTTQSDEVVLRYKTGTAIIHNDGKADGLVLSSDLLTEEGTPIGYNEVTGTIPGCAEYSGYITYTLIAKNAEDDAITTGTAAMWGPERAVFTMEEPATRPVFNSIIDNPTIGDERDFVRIGEIKPEETDLKNMVEICPGHQYLVYVYFHNNASSEYNDSKHNNVGVALRARMSIAFTEEITPDNPGNVIATLSAENSDPLSVYDTAIMTTS